MATKKNFETCTWTELQKIFGLHKMRQLPVLDAWLASGGELPKDVARSLAKLQTVLLENFMDWNEDELKMQFIAPLLYWVDYTDSEDYHPFSQRTLHLQMENIELTGVVDWVLAKGRQFPEEPFFFLHEYKREKGTATDPLGQVLAAMITAQHLNTQKDRVIYGCYVVGKDWYFVALQGRHYAHSLPLGAIDFDALKKIYFILLQAKKLAN